MASVSVVIATRDKAGYLAATLACLAGQRVPADEVLVVDDGSVPPLPDGFGGAYMLRRDARPHLQAARNLGIAAARGEIVLLMDDDCLVQEEFVAQHRWRHEREPGHLVVGSVRRIVYRGEREFWKLPPAPGVAEHRTFERRAELLPDDIPPWNLAPCSNNASVARDALLDVCGYDEDYHGWGVDDVDLTYRLMRAGTPLWIDAAPVVYHQEHPRDAARQAEQEERNLWVFARRRGFWAYGTPPPEYDGPCRYPPEGAWFHAQAFLREGEPPAIRVTAAPEPGPEAPQSRWPLDWVLGAGGLAAARVSDARSGPAGYPASTDSSPAPPPLCFG
jgi:GT2 family glycosyltransferase